MPTPTLDLILPHLPHSLQEALLSDRYSEICVCENGLVFAEVAGRNSMEQLSVSIPTQDQLRKAVNAIARLISRREANDQNPILEARLPDGSRVAAMMPPIVQGITLTVRKFRPNWFTLDELVESGTMPAAAAQLLQLALGKRSNILISGATGSGKTTIVKALLDLIPEDQRVILIEDTAEIRFSQVKTFICASFNRISSVCGFAYCAPLIDPLLLPRSLIAFVSSRRGLSE
jgi:pilus assembly protein CpaF